MRRAWLALPFCLGLVFAASCSDDGNAEGMETGGEDCPIGAAGCPCTAGGSCDEGLECWVEMNLCIPEGSETTTGNTGDGDGDPTTSSSGDGDGDPTTSTTGDGDGDPTTSGDGDGDMTTSGDGDGDMTTSGDGDGDMTTSGDGDGDPGSPELVQVVTGRFHTCALISDGSVRCWGQGAAGALGLGSTDSVGDNEPASFGGAVDVGGSVTAIAAGFTHTCALLDTGAVRCWGSNAGGELGYGNTGAIGDNELPSTAGDVDLGGDAIAITAGDQFSCAVLEGGSVRCWGDGQLGKLGYGNQDDIGDDESPASAGDIDLGGSAVSLSAGDDHVCALMEGGALRCWGRGTDGKLGYANQNNIGDDEAPSSAGEVDVGGEVVAVEAAVFHTCALLATGEVRCWGNGSFGKLGNQSGSDVGDNEHPATQPAIDLGGDAIAIGAGGQHSCAVLEGGGVRCWGIGSKGRLGYGNTNHIGDNESPASAGDIELGANAAAMAVGYEHGCALTTMGTVRCWGAGGAGRLGYGMVVDVGDNETPASKGDVPVLE